MDDIQNLIKKAREASGFSQCRYSGFPVGAALESEHKVYSGCNIESSSYSLTICAERVALAKALSEGDTSFKRIVIYAAKADFCPPCGACRQLLYDYAPELQVILTDGKNHQTYNLSDLLPIAFEESKLKK